MGLTFTFLLVVICTYSKGSVQNKTLKLLKFTFKFQIYYTACMSTALLHFRTTVIKSDLDSELSKTKNCNFSYKFNQSP